MATEEDLKETLDYIENYQLEENEIDLRSYLLDEQRVQAGSYPTYHTLAEQQRKNDGKMKNVAACRRKKEIFEAGKYVKQDEYVKSLLPQPDESETNFAARLFKMCETNLDKVRAAFYFVCTASVDTMPQVPNESPIYTMVRLLRNGSTVKEFEKLLSLAGVPYKSIFGYKKHFRYEHGYTLDSASNRWTGCYVDGEWRLVDSHWGSSAVADFDAGTYAPIDDTGKIGEARENQGKKVYKCEEDFFLTDPEALIVTHLPRTELQQWQLLSQPITLKEFLKMHQLFKGFPSGLESFKVTPLSHPLNVIVALPGKIEILLQEMDNEDVEYTYQAKISIHKTSINDEAVTNLSKSDVNEYFSKKGSVEPNKQVSFFFSPPCKGKFKLSIQVRKETEHNIQTRELTYYVLHCPKEVKGAQPIPEGDKQLRQFGAGLQLTKAGLKTDEPGKVDAEDGEKKIVLESLDQRSHALEYKLLGATNETLSENNLLKWTVGKKTYVVFLSPDSGWYALVVQQNGTSLCQFLLDSPSEFRDSKSFPLPDLKKLGGLGVIDAALSDVIQPASHPEPYVVCEGQNMELKFTTKTHIDVKAELLYIDPSGQEVVSDGFAFVNSSMQGFNVDIRFQLAGHYVQRLYTRNSESEPWKHYCNYFIRSLGQVDGSAMQFPGVGEAWNSNDRLIQPRKKLLPVNEAVPFTLHISDADIKVVYLVNESKNEWNLLTKDSNGLWQGSVKGYRESAGAGMKVMGGADKQTCKELLNYRFETKEDQSTRNKTKQRAEELNKNREDEERLRQRKQENHERKEHALELLPEDPKKSEEEERRREEEAERARKEEEEQRKEAQKKKRQEEDEAQRQQEAELRRKAAAEKKKKEEDEARKAEDAERQEQEERRLKMEEKKRQQEQSQQRKKEAAESSRKQNRDDIRRELEESEAKRKEEKRRKRDAKKKRQEEEEAEERQARKEAREAELMRDQLALTLYKDPTAKSEALGKIIKKMKDKENKTDEDEALILLTERTKQATEYKIELEQKTKRAEKSNDSRDLQSLVAKIESHGFSQLMLAKLEPELSEAKKQIRKIEKQSKARERMRQQPRVELNQRTLTDLCGRNAIGISTHATIQAALLLLGHCELETQSWKRSRILMKKERKLFSVVAAEDVHPEIAARASQLLGSVDKGGISVVVPSLYDWAVELTSMVRERADGKVKPATGKQQMKLLGVSADDAEDWEFDDRHLG